MRNRVLVAALIAGFVCLAGFRLVIRWYRIPTGSMEPTVPIGSQLIAHVTKNVGRGDIVVFRFPRNPSVAYLERIVAVGGDTVEIRAKRLFVNGREAVEPYAVHNDPETYPADPGLPEPYHSRDYFGPFPVPPDSFFTMGDNRDASADSRYWGALPHDAVIGRAALLFSFTHGFRRPR